jgi:ABC-type arginine transport system permease subunit
MLNKENQEYLNKLMSNHEKVKYIEVETLFIGGGPATLGVISNAYQTQRLEDLL